MGTGKHLQQRVLSSKQQVETNTKKKPDWFSTVLIGTVLLLTSSTGIYKYKIERKKDEVYFVTVNHNSLLNYLFSGDTQEHTETLKKKTTDEE